MADFYEYSPIGAHIRNTSLTSAVTLTKSEGATLVRLQALTQAVRYTLDGTTPSASLGFRLAAGAMEMIRVPSDAVIRVIGEMVGAEIQYQWLHMKDE